MSIYSTLFLNTVVPFGDLMRGTRIRRTYGEYMRSQFLSAEELAEKQNEALRSLVSHAYRTVPYYHALFQRAGLTPGDIRTVADLPSIPELTKSDIRANGPALKSRAPISPIFHNHTGGSTGEPLHFLFDGTEKSAANAAIWRAFSWAGVEPGDKVCLLFGGTLGLARPTGAQKLFGVAARRMLLPAFELSLSSAKDYAEKIRRFRPRAVHGYASALFTFARLCKELGIRDVEFDAAVTTAEMLNPLHKAAIESQFGCKVFDLYGSAEVNGIAAQCEHRDGYHITEERVIVEALPSPSNPAVKELLITNLTNFIMPFLRYRSGDSAELTTAPCPCGRHMSRIGRIHGRVFDFIRTACGDYLAGEFFPHLFRSFTSFDFYQIIQEAEREVAVLLVKSPQYSESEFGALRAKMTEYLGKEMSIDYQFMSQIPRTTAGKLRVTVSKIL